jgi:hypothetical protein
MRYRMNKLMCDRMYKGYIILSMIMTFMPMVMFHMVVTYILAMVYGSV